MEHAKCHLCAAPIDSNDHFRELDCTFPNCPGVGYHESCIVRYLRKNGNGPEQKTGYPCPAVLDNGKKCSGTIKKTHTRTPTNEKKKEQSRQAAVAVNQMANAARTSAPPPPQSVTSLKHAATRLKTAPVLVTVASNVAARTKPQKPASRDSVYSDDEEPARHVEKTLADYLTQKKSTGQRMAAKDVLGVGHGKHSVGWRKVDDTTKPSDLTGPSKLAHAISKNASMAPEPVARQRIIPGWSGPTQSSKSSLEQVRAAAAAARAELNASKGRGAGATLAACKPGVSSAAAGPALLTSQRSGGLAGSFSTATSLPGAVDAGLSASYATSEVAAEESIPQDDVGFRLADEDFPQFATPHRSASRANKPPPDVATDASSQDLLTVQTDIPAPATPPAEIEPLASHSHLGPNGSADGSPPAGTIDDGVYPAAAAADLPLVDERDAVDPPVHYELVHEDTDGVLYVDDGMGSRVRVEEVFGPEPEYRGFLYEGAALPVYYVVLRQSHYDAVTAAAASAGAVDCSSGGGGVDPVVMVQAACGAGAAAAGACSWPGDLLEGGQDAVCGAAASAGGAQGVASAAGDIAAVTGGDSNQEGDEDDDLDDLLALCLGGPTQGSSIGVHA